VSYACHPEVSEKKLVEGYDGLDL